MRKHRIAIGLISFALVVAACGDDDAAPATTTTAAPTTTAAVTTTATPAADTSVPASEAPPGGEGDEWDPEFIVNFLAGCGVEATGEECECMLEEFQNRYAFDDFLAWAFEAADDDPRIVEVRDICVR